MDGTTMRLHIRRSAALLVLLATQMLPAAGADAQQAPQPKPPATKPAPQQLPDLKPAFDALRAGDYAKAERILKPMADRKDVRAQFLLGAEVYGPLSPLKNDAKAIPLLKEAAERGFPRAMAVYGGALADGAGVPQDKVEGYKFMALASRHKVPGVEAVLAQLAGELSDEELERAKKAADAFEPRR
jgi:TPR repeat protein